MKNCWYLSLIHIFINGYDKLAAVVEWYALKVLVKAGRRSHEISIKVIKNKREIIKNAVILGAGCIFLVGFFAWATVYEYSYNGRALGVVREKKDVLEILELASEELSQEYGSSIVIDPETDISFRPVVAYGKDVDTEAAGTASFSRFTKPRGELPGGCKTVKSKNDENLVFP